MTTTRPDPVRPEPVRHERRSRRKSKEETRQDLLMAAREMLIEQGSPVGINMKLTDVLKEKGLTTGAAYHIWENQRAFQEDLAMFIAKEFNFAGLAALPPGSIETAGPNPQDRIRALATAYLEHIRQRHEYYLALQLWGVRDPSDELRQAIQDGYKVVHDDFVAAFTASHRAEGRRMKASFTLDDATVVVTALTEGFVLRQRFDESKVTAENGVNLYAEALIALFEHFTEDDDS